MFLVKIKFLCLVRNVLVYLIHSEQAKDVFHFLNPLHRKVILFCNIEILEMFSHEYEDKDTADRDKEDYMVSRDDIRVCRYSNCGTYGTSNCSSPKTLLFTQLLRLKWKIKPWRNLARKRQTLIPNDYYSDEEDPISIVIFTIIHGHFQETECSQKLS